jgi:hypothetical protein
MGRCPRAPIARTTRQNASSPRSRRSAIRPRGKPLPKSLVSSLLKPVSAKYIEGLENRLGRMESLLRLSGLLSEDDLGATDLGTLEKRLQDKTAQLSRERDTGDESSKRTSTPESETRDSASPAEVRASTEQRSLNGHPSPEASTSAPPKSNSGRSEDEVEALSDMMCSLVTNNCGETRYIGQFMHARTLIDLRSNDSRLLVWLFYILPQRHPMGQR